jgi:gluconate 2-dehydrogenase gamma chain
MARNTKATISRRAFVRTAAGVMTASVTAVCAPAPPTPPTPAAPPAPPPAPIAAAGTGVPGAPAPAAPPIAPPPATAANEALLHFNVRQAKLVDALTARIFPTTDTPGAHEADVVIFIDRQLAGYMARPTTTFARDQRPIMRAGLSGVDKLSRTRFQKAFVELQSAQQDQVLADMQDATEDARKAFGSVNSTSFFNLLRTLTIEGMFADPAYGGNKDMIGWALIKFPGPQFGYTPDELRMTDEAGPLGKTKKMQSLAIYAATGHHG